MMTPLTQLSGKEKICCTGLIVASMGFWSILMIGIFWETVSIQCQPSPDQVMCKISGETSPGSTTTLEIPKSQIAAVKRIDGNRRKKIDRRIGLVLIDRTEIPLTRGTGDVVVQLDRKMDQIATFIANPQATTLNIKTQRHFPILLWPPTAFLLWFNSILLKRMLFGFPKKIDH
jgi:hypothetical protein